MAPGLCPFKPGSEQLALDVEVSYTASETNTINSSSIISLYTYQRARYVLSGFRICWSLSHARSTSLHCGAAGLTRRVLTKLTLIFRHVEILCRNNCFGIENILSNPATAYIFSLVRDDDTRLACLTVAQSLKQFRDIKL
jgi:hypothetical protein